MGRFDPNMASAKESRSSGEKKKRKRNKIDSKSDDLDEVNTGTAEEDLVSKESSLAIPENSNESIHESSSSAPSSDDESSEAPSTSDESSLDSDDETIKHVVNPSEEVEEPSMKVIAPEQKYTGLETKRHKIKMTSEGIDDFDQDDSQDNIESSGRKNNEIETALKISRISIREAANLWKLAPFLINNLEEDEYDNFFPIQALVIPDVIASERHAHIRNRDICVAAPTGSGKTLSFVLPVLNSLANRRIKRLRALVVLPSRDLAAQVFKVFQRYSKGSDLSIGLAIGQTDFEAEQSSLIFEKKMIGFQPREEYRCQYALKPFSVKNATKAYSFDAPGDKSDVSLGGCWAHGDLKDFPDLCDTPIGGKSAVDVLVCTPGRLIDHLDKTPGFTLQHLRFLIADEADRLVNQGYQDWIRRVVEAASAGPDRSLNMDSCGLQKLDPVTWRRGIDANDSNHANTQDTNVCRSVQLRKLLFSATLTKDPRKLASLGLVNPKYFDAHSLNNKVSASQDANTPNHSTYSLPGGLSEFMVECNAEQKPLVLMAFLLEQGLLDKGEGQTNGIVVVFTSSVDSTHRLARLLQLFWASGKYGPTSCVGEFSSALPQKQRSQLMKRCNNTTDDPSRVRVVVCSDGMSRGMDISSITAVINYDVPSFAKTYVHRCGRTARAGRSGRAITIMKSGQVARFLKMRQLIDKPQNVEKAGIKKELVNSVVPIYKKCVKALKRVMDAEEDNELSPVATLGIDWIP